MSPESPRPLLTTLRRAAAEALRSPWQLAALVVSLAAVSLTIGLVLGPWFKDLSTFGFHDWDAQTAHRFLVRLSLLRYHQFPSWNPFACGGFPAWGYVEADTIVVSPFLPAYLFLPMSVALRVEVLGMAVVGAVGAWLAASRFTASHAAKALVVVVWAVNGRWALQTASGHTWHLAYAFLPWCLYYFERARSETPSIKPLAGLGASIAMLVYAGGIYPLPHTVLLLGVYALLLWPAERSLRPLGTLALGGLLGLGLSAPKLLPLLDGFKKAPRLIESNETMDLGALVTMLTSHDQAFYSRPVRVSPYGWHEWGIYIGAAALILIVLGFVFVQGRREAALKGVSLLFVALGFGAFHPSAPWPLLHQNLPVFRSQHVPSRFLYPAVLTLALIAAAGIGRWISKRKASLPWLDLALACVVLGLGVDIGLVARKPMEGSMWMVPPDKIPQDRPFHYEQEPPFQYKRRDWAGPMYLAMLGNTGVINCYGTPPFDRRGARPIRDPQYKGEARVEGGGKARVLDWSPNRVTLEVEGAAEGARLVYNMNYDEGWSSDSGPVMPWENTLSTPVGPSTRTVTLSYRPPYLGAGLLTGALTVALLVALQRRARKEEGAEESAG